MQNFIDFFFYYHDDGDADNENADCIYERQHSAYIVYVIVVCGKLAELFTQSRVKICIYCRALIALIIMRSIKMIGESY